jgi:hypothetical protein
MQSAVAGGLAMVDPFPFATVGLLREALVENLLRRNLSPDPARMELLLQGINDALCDLRCTPTPRKPGGWTIEAGSEVGRRWWEASNRPLVGQHLGYGGYGAQEVRDLLREASGTGLAVSIDGRVLEVPRG